MFGPKLCLLSHINHVAFSQSGPLLVMPQPREVAAGRLGRLEPAAHYRTPSNGHLFQKQARRQSGPVNG